LNKSDTEGFKAESWMERLQPADTSAQLPDGTRAQLHRMAAAIRPGLTASSAQPSGTMLLFSGPSGAGKTLAAQALAHELGRPLFRVDLQQVTNKYIGETEKNLSAVFESAMTSNAILFFDEADALFGKRTEVKDSHDRYANMDVNDLTRQIKAFRGIVILAGNQPLPLDGAAGTLDFSIAQ
jgi:SpoVK/Ycf46/Vps4 family AAA+-type ATPase